MKKFHRPIALMILLVYVLITLTGCEERHGLSADIARHFERKGIRIEPLEVHAETWSRSGYVVAKHSPEQVASMVDHFQLAAIVPDSDQERALKFLLSTNSKSKLAPWVAAWGLNGRPKAFKLQNGGQLEYFYLVVTKDGLVYLFAEYAYG